MARATSVQRNSKLFEIISKYYKIICNLLCIIIIHGQKYTYGLYVFAWVKWKSREEAFVCWWSRSHMELEHSKGQCGTLTCTNSLRGWTKLSHFNGVRHLGNCKILIWQTFMALWLHVSQKKSEPHLQSIALTNTVSIHSTIFQLRLAQSTAPGPSSTSRDLLEVLNLHSEHPSPHEFVTLKLKEAARY